MSGYPFKVTELSASAKNLMETTDTDGSLEFANQLREDLKVKACSHGQIALAWTLTKIVKSGVFIDDLWDDIQDAQKALKTALDLSPELAEDSPFLDQQKKTDVIYSRVVKFEKIRQD